MIAEAPSSRSGVLPLTSFDTVNVSDATANGASLGTFGQIGSTGLGERDEGTVQAPGGRACRFC
jgi:hypothetical protein